MKEDAKPNAADRNCDSLLTLTKPCRATLASRSQATDPNDSDLLTYTLSGPDRALFKITSDTDAPSATDTRWPDLAE